MFSLRRHPRTGPRLVAACGALLISFIAAAEEPEYVTTVPTRRADPDGATVTRVRPDSYGGETRHAGELVAASPGTAVLDFGGVLATTTVSVRGASSDQVQVVLGGVPLNPASGGGFDLSLIPAALIDALEVRRGAEGAQFGAGAMGGAVVLEPVSRSRVVLTGGMLGTWGASGSWASAPVKDGWQWLAATDIRRSLGDFLYHRDPTPELPNNDPLVTLYRRNNDATLGSLLIRGERASTGPVTVSGLLWLSASDRGLAGPIYSTTEHSRQREITGFVDVRAKISPHESSATFEVPLTIRTGAYAAFEDGSFESAPLQQTIDLATRPRANWRLSKWTIGLTGLAGVERFDGPVFGGRTRNRFGLGLDANTERTWGSAAFTLRAERWASSNALLPRVGGTWRIAHGFSLNGSVGLGFRPPSFGELYYSSGPLIPNPDLKPEKSANADLGARFRRGGFSIGLTGFAGYYDDIILYEIYPGFRAKPFNIGSSRTFGGELEVRYKPTTDALQGLSFSASATELIATNLEPGANSYGMRLPYRPERRAIGRVDYQRERWRAGFEVQATGEAFINRANTRTLSAFTDLRASAGVRAFGAFWISGEMRNGLNVTDRMTIDGYPMPGRVILAHLSWEPELPQDR